MGQDPFDIDKIVTIHTSGAARDVSGDLCGETPTTNPSFLATRRIYTSNKNRRFMVYTSTIRREIPAFTYGYKGLQF